jgi:SET and MYND domain-containing protein 4
VSNLNLSEILGLISIQLKINFFLISAMFCDEICLKSANEAYHKYECPIIEKLLKSGIMQMAMRTFFQALSMFKGSIEQLQKFLTEYKNPRASVYDFDFSENSSKDKNFLISLFCLTRSDKICETDSPEKLFIDHPMFRDSWEKHEIFIRSFILRVLQIGDSNFHGVCGWSRKKYENQHPQMIGIAVYPFISLVNHSCAPNVNRIYVEDKMLLLVERPIKKGEQLFDCYK